MKMVHKSDEPWSVAHARARFSELLRHACKKPQLIQSRGRTVAAVVDPRMLEDISRIREREKAGSIDDAFEDLRRIAREEDYDLEIPPRQDRTNPLDGPDDEVHR